MTAHVMRKTPREANISVLLTSQMKKSRAPEVKKSRAPEAKYLRVPRRYLPDSHVHCLEFV